MYRFPLVARHQPTQLKDSVISYQLLLRAGFIRNSFNAQGTFIILPDGVRVIQRIQHIVDQRLEEIKCARISMPNLLNAELWKKTGRWESTGKELFRLKDRHDKDFCLGPTHEEYFTELAAQEVESYKQLPLRLYQIGLKYRDEIRPRFGLLRSREFIMKDLYTFDRTQEDAIQTYQEVSRAYESIFSDMGVNAVKVEADSGNIGGSLSHEFHLLCENGEDTIAKCENCGFASNVELLAQPNSTSCPKCNSGNLSFSQGIEVGHVFYLGKKYSSQLNASFMEADGSRSVAEMGCYGIGISRLMAAIVEANHDKDGIIWPAAVSPYALSICHTEDDENFKLAQKLQHDLGKLGIPSLLGNQMSPARPQLGEQIKIATVIGTPYILIIGKKFSTSGKLEIENRKTREKKHLDPESAFQFILSNTNQSISKY